MTELQEYLDEVLVKLNANRYTRLPRAQFVHWGSQTPIMINSKGATSRAREQIHAVQLKHTSDIIEHLAEEERQLFETLPDTEVVVFRRSPLLWTLTPVPDSDTHANCVILYGTFYIRDQEVHDIEGYQQSIREQAPSPFQLVGVERFRFPTKRD